MHCLITRMRHQGKAFEQAEIRSAPVVTGDIIVAQETPVLLGRGSDVATAKGHSGGNDVLIPPLYDCRLSHMGPNGFVLSGIEFEGSTGYAQAWWCRLP